MHVELFVQQRETEHATRQATSQPLPPGCPLVFAGGAVFLNFDEAGKRKPFSPPAKWCLCAILSALNPRTPGVYHPLHHGLEDNRQRLRPSFVRKPVSINRRWRDPGGYRSPWKSRVFQACIRKDKDTMYYKPGDAQGDYRNNHQVSDTRSGWQPKLRSPRRREQRQTTLSKTQTSNPAWKTLPRRKAMTYGRGRRRTMRSTPPNFGG